MAQPVRTLMVKSKSACLGMVSVQVFVKQMLIAATANAITTGAHLIVNATHACALVATQARFAHSRLPVHLYLYHRMPRGVLASRHSLMEQIALSSAMQVTTWKAFSRLVPSASSIILQHADRLAVLECPYPLTELWLTVHSIQL